MNACFSATVSKAKRATIAADHARWRTICSGEARRAVILSGGELTVTISGKGRGGPNQEYALALALALDGTSGIAALAGDTDGTDGGGGSATDPAGAVCRRPECRRARARSASIRPRFLPTTIRPAFSQALGDLVDTRPDLHQCQ